MSWIGLLLKAGIAAVFEWTRQLLADARRRAAKRNAGRAEQVAVNNKEQADANAKNAQFTQVLKETLGINDEGKGV